MSRRLFCRSGSPVNLKVWIRHFARSRQLVKVVVGVLHNLRLVRNRLVDRKVSEDAVLDFSQYKSWQSFQWSTSLPRRC
jgi:hypothetical protein